MGSVAEEKGRGVTLSSLDSEEIARLFVGARNPSIGPRNPSIGTGQSCHSVRRGLRFDDRLDGDRSIAIVRRPRRNEEVEAIG